MEDSSQQERSQQEVIELHQFFQAWFKGELQNAEAQFERFAGVLANDFEIIGPGGNLTSRDTVLKAVRSNHGKHATSHFRIDIRNVRSRVVCDGMVLVTYEEHQTTGQELTAWQSTAIFRAHPETPNRVEWLHVQETYLPATN